MCVNPGVVASTIVHTNEKQQAPACEKDQSDIVDFLDQLPSSLVVPLMLGLELWWEICADKDD